MHPIAFLLATGVVAGGLFAQSVVVPAANGTTAGTGGLNTLTRNSGNPRSYMLLIDAAELTGIPPGSFLTGVSFRSSRSGSNPASWPPSDTSWTDYEILVGNVLPQAQWSGNFLGNFSGPTTQARKGPMTIEAGKFTDNTSLPTGTPNAWGDFYWDFQTPFVYVGGNLGLYFTHPGSNGSTAFYLDYVASGGNTVAYSASSFRATSGGAAASFCIPRLHFGYGAPCAGTGGQSPVLVLTNDVTVPGNTTVAIGNGQPNAPSGFVFGTVKAPVPLPGGCTLQAVPLVVLGGQLSQYGRLPLPLMVPGYVIGTIEIQGVCVDPGAPAGFTLTNAVTLTMK